MQLLAGILGRLVFCLGVMVTVVGCVIGSVAGLSTGTTVPGFTLTQLPQLEGQNSEKSTS